MPGVAERLREFESERGRMADLPQTVDDNLDGIRVQLAALDDAMATITGVLEARLSALERRLPPEPPLEASRA